MHNQIPVSEERPEEQLPARILLVEDDDLQARAMTEAIKKLGPQWKIIHVRTGEECLTLLETVTFSAAIIDLFLPKCTGLDVIRQFQIRGWPIATILVTAHGSEDIAIEALRLGVSDYLKKDDDFLKNLPIVAARTVERHRAHLRQVSEYSRLRVQLSKRDQKSLVDGFAAPIVHDIKNPLTYIRGMAEILVQHPNVTSAKDAGNVILKGAKRISELVDRLLKFARQETEERVSIDLTDFLCRLTLAESERLKGQNVRLVNELVDVPTVVRGACGALEQVFLNLIANAAEALIQNSCGGQITIKLSHSEGYAVVSVTDNGPGIAEEAIQHLFQPFSSFGKGKKGTGLGLSIASGLIREHGGRISGGNLPTGGACFTVQLPLDQQGPLALVLEDEFPVRELITSQLSALGIRADAHADGAEILPVLATGQWDLVLLDLRIPGVGGVEIFQEIQRIRPDLIGKTMIVSGSIEDRALQELMIAHPIPCLPKPYSVHDFNQIIRLLLRRETEDTPK